MRIVHNENRQSLESMLTVMGATTLTPYGKGWIDSDGNPTRRPPADPPTHTARILYSYILRGQQRQITGNIDFLLDFDLLPQADGSRDRFVRFDLVAPTGEVVALYSVPGGNGPTRGRGLEASIPANSAFGLTFIANPYLFSFVLRTRDFIGGALSAGIDGASVDAVQRLL